MEELLTFQLFTPGSDIAIGFSPNQLIWGRTGNDVLLGYQPIEPMSGAERIDILLGDLAIEDPAFRQWRDTFILGDWVGPYYTSESPENFGLNDLALIPDFDPEIDFIQLFGTAENYQISQIGAGSLILFIENGEPDAVGFLLGTTDISLTDSFFQFKGSTPPVGPIIPEVQQFGSASFDVSPTIATDPLGHVYVAGGTNGDLLAENAGLRDNFIVKYDSEGNVLFAEQFGTPGFETIYGIETDNQGNFYITGVTDGELGGPRQAASLDTFVAKYDTTGDQLWIRQIGQNDVFNAFNLAVDKDTGDVFISGANVKPTLEDDTFIIKFDTNGEQQWFTETGLSGFLSFDESYGLTVADDGSVYTTGWTSGDLGGPNAGLYDNWLGKYDNATGENLWLVQYGTPDYEWSWDVRTDSEGNVYTAGWTLGNLGGTNAGSFDAYLTKFNDQGDLLWVEQFGSAGDDEAFSLYIDDKDNLFVAGYTDGDLGGDNVGSFDVWVAKYNQNGKQIWINQFGTPDRDELYDIAVDGSGNLYATGITQGSLGAVNAGSFDGWSAKLDAASGKLLDFGADADPDPIDENSIIIDLTGFDGDAALSLTVEREASFNNILRFYETDAQGRVDGLSPGDAGYEAVVADNLLNVELFVENNAIVDFDLTLAGDKFYAPALLIDGQLTNLATIEDGVLGNVRVQRDGNVWSFEDYTDNDFNDLVLTLHSVEAIA